MRGGGKPGLGHFEREAEAEQEDVGQREEDERDHVAAVLMASRRRRDGRNGGRRSGDARWRNEFAEAQLAESIFATDVLMQLTISLPSHRPAVGRSRPRFRDFVLS